MMLSWMNGMNRAVCLTRTHAIPVAALAVVSTLALSLLCLLPASARAQVNGYTFTHIADSTQGLSCSAPSVNDFGTCAFVAHYIGTNTFGIFAGDGSDFPVAITDTDGELLSFGTQTPPINNSGLIAFRATKDNGGQGVYTGSVYSPGFLTTIADTETTYSVWEMDYGNPHPEIRIWSMGFSSFGAYFEEVGLNNNGVVAFRGVSKLYSSGDAKTSVFMGNGSNILLAVHFLGGAYIYGQIGYYFGGPMINDDNWVAYYYGWAGFGRHLVLERPFTENMSGHDLNDEGYFLTGVPPQLGLPSLNANNRVAFTNIDGGTSAVLTSIANPASPTPATYQGFTITRVIESGQWGLQRFGNVSINDADRVAFLGYGGDGNVSYSPRGIYVGRPYWFWGWGWYEIAPVIKSGDELFGSTVASVSFSRRGLNNSGQVAFSYVLTDGRSGVACATPDVYY